MAKAKDFVDIFTREKKEIERERKKCNTKDSINRGTTAGAKGLERMEFRFLTTIAQRRISLSPLLSKDNYFPRPTGYPSSFLRRTLQRWISTKWRRKDLESASGGPCRRATVSGSWVYDI